MRTDKNLDELQSIIEDAKTETDAMQKRYFSTKDEMLFGKIMARRRVISETERGIAKLSHFSSYNTFRNRQIISTFLNAINKLK